MVWHQNVLLFSHPLPTQYRSNAPHGVKQIVRNAVLLLLGQTLVRHNGPSTLAVNLLHQLEQHRYTLHLLSYVPMRKSATIDIINQIQQTKGFDTMTILKLEFACKDYL